jgi:PIF1-like helicase
MTNGIKFCSSTNMDAQLDTASHSSIDMSKDRITLRRCALLNSQCSMSLTIIRDKVIVKRALTTLENKQQLEDNFSHSRAVVRVPYFMASSDKENYYLSLLQQYKPYRNEEELTNGYPNAKAAFTAREQELKDMNRHMEVYRARDKQLENAFNQVHALEVLERPEPAIENDEEEVEIDDVMDDAQFANARRNMNDGQCSLYEMIRSSIETQMSDEQAEPKRLFITGGAGTGKTFVFNVLKNLVYRSFGKHAVKVGALTGVAARLVGGLTLHSLLKLPVQKDGRITSLPLLTGNYLRMMRLQWKDCKFLFIDEISMVAYEMLCSIDSRLRQIKKNDQPFGGINVLLFGDLMQLPPIRGHQVFIQPEKMVPATHLWRLFKLVELTRNMRQHGDTIFQDILNALRIGELQPQHLAVLMDKVGKEPTGEFSIERALRILPTNVQVDEHNQAVLQHFRDKNTEMFKIKAQDTLVDATRNTANLDLERVTPTDINTTAGLPKELEIFVGAKVMLRSNIDVAKGLVNGLIGHITEIIWPHYHRGQLHEYDIPTVRVDFGNNNIHLISPITKSFPAKYSYGTMERRMLPMILSWASTVHKMQGSTVDYAVIDLGPALFASGQAYVALSRVRSLDGLQILDLDCTKLTGKKPCNNEALAEMDRLRSVPDD